MKFQIKIEKHIRIKEEQKKEEHEESLEEQNCLIRNLGTSNMLGIS